jgi:flagellar hook-basal body complex protein FliE
MKLMHIRHLIAALALAAAAPFAGAAFQPGMTVEQAEAEVRLQRTAGATLAQIIQNAQKAPLNAGLITTALINGTDSSIADIVEALLRAGAPLQVVVNAALAAGASSAAVLQGALAAGTPLPDITAAIAASPTTFELAGRTPPNGATGAGGGGGTCTRFSVSPC